MKKNNKSVKNDYQWHALESGRVFNLLKSRPQGLTDSEFASRSLSYGPNRLPAASRRSAIMRFASQFKNILIYVLLGAAVITSLLHEWANVAVILAVVLVNAVIGFIQEGKAERALEAIAGALPRRAQVRRNGRSLEIDAEMLVPGDVIELSAGDKVPADARLFMGRGLRCDEGLLTGESGPVGKDPAPVDSGADLALRRCMLWSGTVVTYGQGAAVVTETGGSTEIGRISALVSTVKELETPFTRQMTRMGRWLSMGILAVAGATVAFGIFVRRIGAIEMLLAGVGLAVAAIPEGLPAIVTIALAIGVRRMAKRQTIIRRLPAVETLGSVSVICSDKTGTLTRNEMTACSIVSTEGTYAVSGVGYDLHGIVTLGDEPVSPATDATLGELGRAGLLCNDARIVNVDGQVRYEGDPTEIALVVLAAKLGYDPSHERDEYPRDDVIPFDPERRFMVTKHHDHASHHFAVIKGAPEVLLEMCAFQRQQGQDVAIDLDYWRKSTEQRARHGERLLAVAFQSLTADSPLALKEIEGGLTLLGIAGLFDAPREEAVSALKECRHAGIEVKMITGDHAVTAMEIGRQMGIGDGNRTLTGREIDLLDNRAMEQAVNDVDVFARTTPEHKLRLVKALQAQHRIVAMTGDGVNDAPALKQADIGIAMGMRGTDAAKEAAPMVLADDNFATIVQAVKEGRTVYDNLKKTILFILPTAGAEALVIIAAILLGISLPITPLQILWVNTVTAVTLSIPLVFEPPEEGVMQRPPRDPKRGVLGPIVLWRIVFVSVLGLVGTFGLFIWERRVGVGLAEARTVAVNTLVLIEVCYLFNVRFLVAPAFRRIVATWNPYILLVVCLLLLAQLAFVYAGPMQELFSTAGIGTLAWLRSLGVGMAVFLIVEVEKSLIRLFHLESGL